MCTELMCNYLISMHLSSLINLAVRQLLQLGVVMQWLMARLCHFMHAIPIQRFGWGITQPSLRTDRHEMARRDHSARAHPCGLNLPSDWNTLDSSHVDRLPNVCLTCHFHSWMHQRKFERFDSFLLHDNVHLSLVLFYFSGSDGKNSPVLLVVVFIKTGDDGIRLVPIRAGRQARHARPRVGSASDRR